MMEQIRFHPRMGTNRFGREAQQVNHFTRFVQSRQALRAARFEVLPDFPRALLGERTQEKQLVEIL